MTCRHLCAALAIIVAMSGCTTLSQGQCLTGDWFMIGRQDGADGLQRSRLFDHREACAQYGVIPDPAAYEAGRRAGLLRYCTPDSGYREGRQGHPYRSVCPLPTEPGFLAGYRNGRVIHDAQEALEDVDREISSREHRLEDEDEALTDDERHRLLMELRDLHRDYRHLQRELDRLRYLHGRPGYR